MKHHFFSFLGGNPLSFSNKNEFLFFFGLVVFFIPFLKRASRARGGIEWFLEEGQSHRRGTRDTKKERKRSHAAAPHRKARDSSICTSITKRAEEKRKGRKKP